MVEDINPLPTDAELISQAKAGQVEAFGDLYQRYLDPIYRYIRIRVAEDSIAEDLTEIVFLRAFETLDRYKERGKPFSAFLYQVARNLLVDHYRQGKREVPLEAVDDMVVTDSTVDEHVIQNERKVMLQQTMDDLRPDYQEVIRLRVIMALPTATVALWMGRSEGAVRVLLHRALNAMRESLVEDDE
ncbi:MAG: sigma-70 family RNA polymerase sigma factor [Anaerolineaceae bacterium]|nr:MAG: sigma-70 family RNA polymerase sigma factor [Anaerolineaceae bacterium]